MGKDSPWRIAMFLKSIRYYWVHRETVAGNRHLPDTILFGSVGFFAGPLRNVLLRILLVFSRCL
jgi:hypothetical protein